MPNYITYKTEPNEIITVEEVAILFDSVSKKHQTSLVSFSLFPTFNDLRQRFLDKALIQRNTELSDLLSKICDRKQELKIKIWQELGKLSSSKKSLEKSQVRSDELEQIIYEQEQVINAYETSLEYLNAKEKKIMNGKYSRLDKASAPSPKKVLKRQLESLKDALLDISRRHDNCFQELENDLMILIDKAVINSTTKFPENISQDMIYKNANQTFLNIEFSNESGGFIQPTNQIIKDYYLYEPDEDNLDDDLIFQLLEQGDYDDRDGTINGILIPLEDD